MSDISEAIPTDIADMHRIRMMVKENRLSDATKIKASNYAEMITTRGRGWVYRISGTIRGFAIVDMSDGNVWALFVEPGFERLGIGRALHDIMVGWAFDHGAAALWLTTDRATRAENFYRRQGWREAGSAGHGELRFELKRSDWTFSA